MNDAATMRALIARVEAAQGADACWIWPRAKDAAGRGRFWLNGKLMLAHRAAWTVQIGPIPAGAFLCHHCDNPSCVNPRHLYVGTHHNNMRDMRERGRSMARRHPELAKKIGQEAGRRNTWNSCGGNIKAKLSEAQVLAIRQDTRPTRQVASAYGVDRTTIQRIRRGALWPHAALRARLATMEDASDAG